MDLSIPPELTVDQLLDCYPVLSEFFVAHSMACIGCYIAGLHTLEDIAAIYRVTTQELIDDLTAYLERSSPGHAETDTLDN